MDAKSLCEMMLENAIKWEIESNDEDGLDADNAVAYAHKLLDFDIQEDGDELIKRIESREQEIDGPVEPAALVEIIVGYLDETCYFDYNL